MHNSWPWLPATEEYERWAGLLVRLVLAPKCSSRLRPRPSRRPLQPPRSRAPESALVYAASVGSRLAAADDSRRQQTEFRRTPTWRHRAESGAHGSRRQRRCANHQVASPTTSRRSRSPATAEFLPSDRPFWNLIWQLVWQRELAIGVETGGASSPSAAAQGTAAGQSQHPASSTTADGRPGCDPSSKAGSTCDQVPGSSHCGRISTR
jgi:hypothetical protein